MMPLRLLSLMLVMWNEFSWGDLKFIPSNTQEETEEQRSSINYLRHFGYIEDDARNDSTRNDTGRTTVEDDGPVVGSSTSAEVLTLAVQEFQLMANLDPTGVLDGPTKAMMDHPRCGNPDLSKGPVQEFKLSSTRWKQTNITYRLVRPSSSSRLSRSQSIAEKEIAEAFSLWSAVSPLRFGQVAAVATDRQRKTQSTQREGQRQEQPDADILISFVVRDHGDQSPFDGPGLVLAHAFPPGEGKGGDIHFDDEERWSVGSEDGVNLFTVTAHELGHALGLDHSSIQGSLMYPWYQGYTPNFRLHSDDVSAIQALYGGQKVSYVPAGEPRMNTKPNPCSTVFDTITAIRGEIFIFRNQWFWRRARNWTVTNGPARTSQFWTELPAEVGTIDAAYERREDNRIVFFSGKRFFEFDGRSAVDPKAGRALTELGLPDHISRIDAVFVWPLDHRTYVTSGRRYWKLTGTAANGKSAAVDGDARKRTASAEADNHLFFRTLLPIRSAFLHPDGEFYVFRENSSWRFNTQNRQINGPTPIQRLWLICDSTSSPMKLNFRNLALAVLVFYCLRR